MAFYRRLGELLLAAGTITQEELERGLELQKTQKGRLGEVLIANGIITEDDLIQALQRRFILTAMIAISVFVLVLLGVAGMGAAVFADTGVLASRIIQRIVIAVCFRLMIVEERIDIINQIPRDTECGQHDDKPAEDPCFCFHCPL